MDFSTLHPTPRVTVNAPIEQFLAEPTPGVSVSQAKNYRRVTTRFAESVGLDRLVDSIQTEVSGEMPWPAPLLSRNRVAKDLLSKFLTLT